MLDNHMAVITSDGGRFDNCFNAIFEGNLVWQYGGSNNNGAYKGGANGVQIGDAGSSMGYNGQTNILHSTNIKVTNNTIIDPGRESIVVDAAGQKPSTNVHIQNNIFVDTNEVKKMGIPVSDDISSVNPPTIEQSENVFNSIFDILNFDFITSGLIGNKTIYVNGTLYDSAKAPKNLTMTLEQHPMGNQSYTLLYGPSEGLTKVQVESKWKRAEHTLMIGEVKPGAILYTPVNSWSGDIPHIGDCFKLDGIVQAGDIEVQCYTPVSSFTPLINITKIENPEHLFNPLLKWVFLVVFGAFAYIYLTIKYS
jgi:hypothetical protein